MVRVDYKQTKINKTEIIVPVIFYVVGIFMICNGYYKEGLSAEFYSQSLVPALGLIAFISACSYGLAKQHTKKVNEIKKFLENGYRVDGEVLNINTHNYTVRKKSGTYRENYFTFTVKYTDPFTGKEVIKESIRTFTYYKLNTNYCALRVLDGEVLVESVDAVKSVDVVKCKIDLRTQKIITIVIFLLIISVILLFVISILGTSVIMPIR